MTDALTDLARAALVEADDFEAAAALLARHAQADPATDALLIGDARLRAAREAIRRVAGQQRTRAWTPPVNQSARGRRLGALVAEALMDMRLPDGTRLRDATAPACRQGAEFYSGRAATMAWRARWLHRIADSLGNGTVAEALDEDALRALQEETRHAA